MNECITCKKPIEDCTCETFITGVPDGHINEYLVELLNSKGTYTDAAKDKAACSHFHLAMETKLAQKRAEGRGGWYFNEPDMNHKLFMMLNDHVLRAENDPEQLIDIANLAMFLFIRKKVLGI